MMYRAMFLIFMTFTCLAQNFKSFELGSNFYQLENMGNSKSLEAGELPAGDVRNFSSIYDQILQSYGESYNLIGTRLSNEAKNGLFGGMNMIGWKHAGEFSSFNISFNRSIAPSLFQEDKYIVNDEVLIEIDAARFLKKLVDQDIIRMSENNRLAFAGLVFKRTMRYNHFADSVTDGLQTRFDKLFFMFKYFKGKNLLGLSEYDYLSKEDSFTLSAGGLVTAPVATYGSIGAGVLYSYEKKSKVTIQKLGALDEKRANEVVRLGVEDQKISKVGANVTLLIDFFKILKLTLFQYELEYKFSKSYKTYLSLFNADFENVDKLKGISDLLKFKKINSVLFKENITSLEFRQKQIKKSRYLAFIFGGVKESMTENIEIVKDGVLHKFFKHKYEKLRYKENFLSKILTAILGKLIGFEQLAARTEVDQRTVRINYEAKINLMKTKKDYNIFNKNVFTMELGNRFRINQKTKLNRKKIEKKMKYALQNRSKSFPRYQKLFEDSEISAPSEFTSTIVMDNTNIAHFIKLAPSYVFKVFKSTCKSKSKNIFKRFRSLFSGCRSKLYKSYNIFLKEWTTSNYTGGLYRKCKRKYRFRYLFRPSKRRVMVHKCMEMNSKKSIALRDVELPIWRFKDVANAINNRIYNISTIDLLFGKSFNKGSFSAKINSTTPYKSFYSEGESKHNIITQFQIKSKLRSPASVE